jgi:hypothetical protein
VSLLDVLLRTIPFSFAGLELITRGKWRAGTGIELEDDPINKQTIIKATGSVVPISPLTTKGDLYTRGASADARLPVGSNGQWLTADSTQANGIKWSALPGLSAHASTHLEGGSDPIVGATIDYNPAAPTNYTPSASNLGGHFVGVDTALGLRALAARTVTAGQGCSGGGALTADITINVDPPTQQYATASVTSSDGNAATASALSFTPVGGRYPAVFVNGVRKRVGGLTHACYFSADGGTTAVADGSIASGNTLRWNGSIAGGQLAGTEEILIEAIAQ